MINYITPEIEQLIDAYYGMGLNSHEVEVLLGIRRLKSYMRCAE